jgi:hypothetical protein
MIEVYLGCPNLVYGDGNLALLTTGFVFCIFFLTSWALADPGQETRLPLPGLINS